MSTTRLNFWLAILLFLLPPVARGASADTILSGCPIVKMEVERLPDLNIPRAGHQLFFTNGEYVVAGGHTNGFIPTPTAEYFKDGEWHTMQMTYTHDFGFSVVLKSGKVLIGGGSSEPIGIGQTYLAEMYEPQSHSFYGFGSLDQKRTAASALELDSGRVVISGNWYHDDGIEMFDGHRRFTYIKDVTEHRAVPFLFRIASDDALIMGHISNRNDTLYSTYADRLKGDTVHIPLLETWRPLSVWHHAANDGFIGDEQKGQYSYLMAVVDSCGQIAVARVDNGAFSLLPTAGPLPMSCLGDSIFYSCNIVADRQKGRAYMLGCDSGIKTVPEQSHRLYILRIDYAQATGGRPAPLTLYYTDPIDFVPDCSPVITPEGDLLIAGGLKGVSNFTPSASVCLLHIGGQQTAAADSPHYWLWGIIALTLLLLTALGIWLVRRPRVTTDGEQSTDEEATTEPADPLPAVEPDDSLSATEPDAFLPATEPDDSIPAAESDDTLPAAEPDEGSLLLMQRIRQLMEQERLYTNVKLKVTDVAARLGTNNRYVSDCIRQCEGSTFSSFVNGYRIRYAQQLMRASPKRKVSSVYLEAGFANESTFFRTFKAFTGMTPKEWMAQSEATSRQPQD